jgi:hypothetical protein
VASRTEGNRGSGGGIVRIAGNIIIDRLIDEVFDFVADERNEPRYNRRMRRARSCRPARSAWARDSTPRS